MSELQPFDKLPSNLGFILVITRLHAGLKTIRFQGSSLQELNKRSNTCLFIPYFCLSNFIQDFFFFPKVIHTHFLLKYCLCLYHIMNINKIYSNGPFQSNLNGVNMALRSLSNIFKSLKSCCQVQVEFPLKENTSLIKKTKKKAKKGILT